MLKILPIAIILLNNAQKVTHYDQYYACSYKAIVSILIVSHYRPHQVWRPHQIDYFIKSHLHYSNSLWECYFKHYSDSEIYLKND